MQRRSVLVALFLCLGLGCSLPGTKAEGEPHFSFVHCSDIHVPPGVQRRTGPDPGPRFGSEEVIAQIKSLTAPVAVPAYGITAPAPAFAIATGDLTEFGGGNGWWDQYLGLWKGAPFPVWHVSGNHDSTWACQRHQLRRLHGSPFYLFQHQGCYFIGWDSATPQDPRPSFGEEELVWLRKTLRRIPRSAPLFLFCHHPLESNEFASPYERDRLLDTLREHNLVLLLVGHGHNVRHNVVNGIDQVMGGSTFGNAPGYSVVTISEGKVRVAYRRAWEAGAERKVLEKPLLRQAPRPRLRILHPQNGKSVSGKVLQLRVKMAGGDVREVRWQADDEAGRTGLLTPHGSEWRTAISLEGWEAGAHYVRCLATTNDGATHRLTVAFYTTPTAGPRVAWRARMGGSGKGNPAAGFGLVVAGAQDGGVYAYDAQSGRRKWVYHTGGEILAQPLMTADGIFIGSGDGSMTALDHRGRRRWRVVLDDPVYSSAVAAGDRIIFGTNGGRLVALDARTGERVWENRDPGYTIESRPFVRHDHVYAGSWDGYLYAVRLSDGRTAWKTQGIGSKASAPGVARYYAPADAPPVVAGGNVWIADRMYRLGILDAAYGRVLMEMKDTASVAPSEDGKSLYLRGTDGLLRKVGLDGREVWKAPARTGFLPSSAAEAGGVVYSNSATGRLVALDAASGRLLWEYQVTPRLYVFSDPVAAEGRIYVTGMDGTLTALIPPTTAATGSGS